jgi:hypothetical protein
MSEKMLAIRLPEFCLIAIRPIAFLGKLNTAAADYTSFVAC